MGLAVLSGICKNGFLRGTGTRPTEEGYGRKQRDDNKWGSLLGTGVLYSITVFAFFFSWRFYSATIELHKNPVIFLEPQRGCSVMD